MTTTTRRQVVAYRAAAQGLHRDGTVLAASAVLDLGLQDTPAGAARLAAAARVDVPAGDLADGGAADPLADPALSMVWGLRGAPHVHRTNDLPALTAALWPSGDADAGAKLAWNAARIRDAGTGAAAAVAECAGAVASLVADTWPGGEPDDAHPALSKSALSSGVTARVSAGLKRFCEGCGCTHVHEQLLRLAGLPGGLRLVGTAPAFYGPLAGWTRPPDAPGDPSWLIGRYLRLHGPASAGDVAGFLGTTRAVVKDHWPDDLETVDVDGRRAWIPADATGELAGAQPPEGVRLLPPGDPLSAGRDREVLVPDAALRRVVWRALGNAGVVFAGGDLAGTWRPKASGRRLTIAVEPFGAMSAADRRGVRDEAARVAAVRGLDDVTVTGI